MYVYSESVLNYTMHLDNTNIKSIPFGQNKRYKNSLFFLSGAPTHHSFTFDSYVN